VIALYKLAATGFHGVPGLPGLLQRHFEESHVPARLPDFRLLVLVFVLSSCLDNIAVALIGDTTTTMM